MARSLGRRFGRITLQNLVLLLLFFCYVVGVVGEIVFAPTPTMAANRLLALMIAFVLLGPIVWRLAAGRRVDVFAPQTVVSLILFLSYVVSISIAESEHDFFTKTYQISFSSFEDTLNHTLWLILGAVVAMRVGFATAARLHSIRPTIRYRWNIRPPVFFAVGVTLSVFALCALSLAVVAVGGPQVFLSNLGNRVVLFTGLNYFIAPLVFMLTVMIVWFSMLMRDGKPISVPFIAYAAFAVGTNTMAGSKTNVFSALVALVIIYHYQRRRLSFASVTSLASIVVVVAYVFDLFFREYLTVGYFVTVDGLFTEQFFAQLLPSFLGNSFIQLQTLMIMIEGMPTTLPYQNGQTFLSLFFAAVPRAWMPDKPDSPAGVFSAAFFPAHLAHGTSIPPSYLGEFYMNFGPIGVVLGGFVAGYGLFSLYKGFLRRRRDHLYVAFYAIVTSLLQPVVRGESLGLGVLFIFILMPLLVFRVVSSSPKPMDRPAVPPLPEVVP